MLGEIVYQYRTIHHLLVDMIDYNRYSINAKALNGMNKREARVARRATLKFKRDTTMLVSIFTLILFVNHELGPECSTWTIVQVPVEQEKTLMKAPKISWITPSHNAHLDDLKKATLQLSLMKSSPKRDQQTNLLTLL